MILYDLREILSSGILLADTDGDGFPDNTRFSFRGVSERCCPCGLIDFAARTGLETCGISLTGLFGGTAEDGGWLITLEIRKISCARCLLIPGSREIRFSAESEDELSRLLRWMAGAWPQAAAGLFPEDTEIRRIEFQGGRFRVGDASGKTGSWNFAEERKADRRPLFPDIPQPVKPVHHRWILSGRPHRAQRAVQRGV